MNGYLGMLRFFIRSTDPGKVCDLSLSRQLVKAFYIPFFADLQRAIHKDFNKTTFSGLFSDTFSVFSVGRDKRNNGNQSGIQKQTGNFADTSNIFLPVFL